MENVFDRVPRKLFWKIMSEPPYSIPKKLIKVTKSMYINTVSQIGIEDVDTDWYNIEAGVRQGDGLSPLLIITLMDMCTRVTNQKSKQQVLSHADTVAVTLDTIQELQDVASSWLSTITNNGISIHRPIRKTEFMHMNRRREKFDAYMEDRKMYHTNFYKHPEVVVVVDEGNVQGTELSARTEEYTKIFMMMYPLLKKYTTCTTFEAFFGASPCLWLLWVSDLTAKRIVPAFTPKTKTVQSAFIYYVRKPKK